jgi:hypothetical protein
MKWKDLMCPHVRKQFQRSRHWHQKNYNTVTGLHYFTSVLPTTTNSRHLHDHSCTAIHKRFLDAFAVNYNNNASFGIFMTLSNGSYCLYKQHQCVSIEGIRINEVFTTSVYMNGCREERNEDDDCILIASNLHLTDFLTHFLCFTFHSVWFLLPI